MLRRDFRFHLPELDPQLSVKRRLLVLRVLELAALILLASLFPCYKPIRLFICLTARPAVLTWFLLSLDIALTRHMRIIRPPCTLRSGGRNHLQSERGSLRPVQVVESERTQRPYSPISVFLTNCLNWRRGFPTSLMERHVRAVRHRVPVWRLVKPTPVEKSPSPGRSPPITRKVFATLDSVPLVFYHLPADKLFVRLKRLAIFI